jgi:hypothetical protein
MQEALVANKLKKSTIRSVCFLFFDAFTMLVFIGFWFLAIVLVRWIFNSESWAFFMGS